MSDQSDQTQKQPPDPAAADPQGQADEVPVESWIQHPVSDSAEYLDRPEPQYGDGLDGPAKDEYEAQVAEREKRLSK